MALLLGLSLTKARALKWHSGCAFHKGKRSIVFQMFNVIIIKAELNESREESAGVGGCRLVSLGTVAMKGLRPINAACSFK